MANKRQKRAKKDLINESETNKSENLKPQFKSGDLTWVKIRDSSYWPAQVVDEEIVSNKPKKDTKDDIFCRLYGTYQYVYVNASKSNSEFEDVLKRENRSIKEKFLEVLKEDISQMKLELRSNRKSSNSKSKSKDINISKASKENKKAIENNSDISVTKLNIKSNKSKASKSKDINIVEASKEKMKESNLTQESTQNVSAIKKKQDSNKGKRKLDFQENKKEPNPKSESSKQKTLIITKKQKITNISKKEPEKLSSPTKLESSKEKTLISDKKQKNTKNLNQEISRRSPRNFPKENSKCSNLSSPKTKNNEINSPKEKKSASKSENEEELKAKDIKIRKIVRDILYGNTPKKDQNTNESPKKDSNVKSKNIKAKEKVEKKNETKNSKKIGKKDNNNNNNNNVAKEKGPDLETTTPLSVPVQVVQEKGSLSERKIRIMQNLALIAPLGSPFGKNGLIVSSP